MSQGYCKCRFTIFFDFIFSGKVLNIKHLLFLNMGRSFSLISSLHCYIVSIANSKTYLRRCAEAMGKPSFILN